MSHTLKIRAFKVIQPGLAKNKAVFCGTVKVSDLIDQTAFKVDFWEKEKEGEQGQGYQRKIYEGHVKKISDFLCESDSILPSSVLLSTREYIPELNESSLVIDRFPIFIVDGQHRIEGLKDAVMNKKIDHWEQATVPAIILSGFSQFEEMIQFVDLNTKNKKVATDLALELMLEMAKDGKWKEKFRQEGSDWKPRAIKLVNELNKRGNSPWHSSIKMPGETIKTGNFRTAASSFAASLKPLISGVFEYNREMEKNIEILSIYWFLLREIFRDAFLQPKEYAIQKTPGLFPLHTLLQAVLSKKGYEFGFKRAEFKDLLQKVFVETETDTDFWRSDNRRGAAMYGSMKGFRLLSEKFIEALNSLE